MSTITYLLIDAFTTTAFKGNGAAVIVLDPSSPLPDPTLQAIAAEFNLSETAYVTPIDPAKGRFGLRWFTPKVEVALCGHATLASAFALFLKGTILPRDVKLIEFETVSAGVLTAKALPDGRIELEFPAVNVVTCDDVLERKVREVVQRAFHLVTPPPVKFVEMPDKALCSHYLIVEVDAAFDLENASVTADPFRELAPVHTIIIVTQRGTHEKETFRSRVFAPAHGIPEDPVCGSAHCLLGPYWANKLQIQGPAEMFSKPVSARSGEVGVSLDIARNVCKIRGNATLVAKGELYLQN